MFATRYTEFMILRLRIPTETAAIRQADITDLLHKALVKNLVEYVHTSIHS